MGWTAGVTGAPALPSDEEFDVLFKGLGYRLRSDETSDWLVEGLIHPGITCILGQPERGKTTLLISLCAALIDGDKTWLGGHVRFREDQRIIYFCEDRSSGERIKEALGSDRVQVVGLHRWEAAQSIEPAVMRFGAGLVIVDSIYPAVGDVNEQARADVFLSVVQAVDVPVVVVHHEAKDGGGSPAGVQRFAAAYRHTLKVGRCSVVDADEMQVEITVSGNDVPGKRKMTARLNRRTLTAEVVDEITKKRSRLSGPERAAIFGAMARDQGLQAGLTHNLYATSLVGGSRGNEDPVRCSEISQRLDGRSVSHQTVANCIRDYSQAFNEGFTSAAKAA